MLLQLQAKTKRIPCFNFTINLKTRFFPKTSFKSILQLCATEILRKTSEENCKSIFIRLETPNFGTILAPFGLKTSKQNFTPKNHLRQFRDYCCSNFTQKIRTMPCFHFSSKLKNLISGPFWAFLAWKPQTKIFSTFLFFCIILNYISRANIHINTLKKIIQV